MNDVCVVGIGRIGLPIALLLSSNGLRVHGVDIDQRRIDRLADSSQSDPEPGITALLHEVLSKGLFSFSSEVLQADAYVIAVPTPLSSEGAPDLSAVVQAAESIVPALDRGNLVVVQSTVPVGTTRDVVVPILNQAGLSAGEDFDVAYCPERALPGDLLGEICNSTRVVGGLTSEASDRAAELYGRFATGQIHKTTLEVAEMVKLAENTYRDVNIALANELARLAERHRINVWEVRELANLHPRVALHYPGAGVGGHCIPVDPYFLHYSDPDNATLISAARTVNDAMPGYVAGLIRDLVGDQDTTVALLGATYKEATNDTRNSPATAVLRHLAQAGFEVTVTDPVAEQFETPILPFKDAIASADLLAFLVGHGEYRRLDARSVAQQTSARMVIDVCNCLDHQLWREAGFQVYLLGAGLLGTE